MFNTYGIHSVNQSTINQQGDSNLIYPKEVRDSVVTALRVNNLIFNILGYIPGVSLISGATRIGIGTLMLAFTVTVGDPFATQGMIVGRWYNEMIFTSIAQIFRGAAEAFIPFGWAVNLALDGLGTFVNFALIMKVAMSEMYEKGSSPHNEPRYPPLLSPLYLA